jgi:hypothetical protein
MKFIIRLIINPCFSEVKRPGRALGGFSQRPASIGPSAGKRELAPPGFAYPAGASPLKRPKKAKAIKDINLSLPKVRSP